MTHCGPPRDEYRARLLFANGCASTSAKCAICPRSTSQHHHLPRPVYLHDTPLCAGPMPTRQPPVAAEVLGDSRPFELGSPGRAADVTGARGPLIGAMA